MSLKYCYQFRVIFSGGAAGLPEEDVISGVL